MKCIWHLEVGNWDRIQITDNQTQNAKHQNQKLKGETKDVKKTKRYNLNSLNYHNNSNANISRSNN